MKHLVKSWLDTDSFNKLKTVAEERGVSEFIRQAIEEKINNISQNGKALKQLINNNSNAEIKEIQNQLSEVQIQNKVLFEQQQKYLSLQKLILERATTGSIAAAIQLETKLAHEAKSIIDKKLADDFARLKL